MKINARMAMTMTAVRIMAWLLVGRRDWLG